MKAKATAAWGAVAGVVAFAAIACSSEDVPPADSPGLAGANATVGGGAPVAGSASNVAGSAQPSAGTSNGSGGAAGTTSSAGSASGGTLGGGSSGGSNGGGATAGSAGAAGKGGGSSGGSGGGGGATETKPSMGCNKPATGALNQWVESMVMTSGANRPYSVRLPTGYDQTRAYPVIVLLHGCGSGTNNVPMEKATGSDAILVRGTGSAADTCWDTSATGKDVAFFDSIVTDVKARFCADEHRFFVVGYSSGSWLVNQLTCIRTDVIRGGASVTGGESSNGKCGSPVARIFVHDSTDTTNQISGSIKARDRQLTQNMCAQPAMSAPVEPSPCTLYQGCAAGYPVEWCQTSGKAHGRQDDFAPSLFWNFFKGL
jgi:poly(3-hydroxybutyrate) depolymerase